MPYVIRSTWSIEIDDRLNVAYNIAFFLKSRSIASAIERNSDISLNYDLALNWTIWIHCENQLRVDVQLI